MTPTCWPRPRVTADRHREILGIDIGPAESDTGRTTLFRGVNARVLTCVRLVTSAARGGLLAAVNATLEGAAGNGAAPAMPAHLQAVCPKHA